MPVGASAAAPGGRLGGVSDSATVRLRPYRIRLVCRVAAVLVLAVFAGAAGTLHGATGDGPATFQRGDQFAMVGLGVLGALGILLFTRPRVEADAERVRVRNLVGSYELPWDAVRAVRFDRGAAFASLELHDDERVPVLALQAVDRQRAVDGVRALRALHGGRRAAPADT